MRLGSPAVIAASTQGSSMPAQAARSMLSSWLGLPWRMALESDPIGQFSATSGPSLLPFGKQPFNALAKKAELQKKISPCKISKKTTKKRG
jgi:hypothetical protein